MKSNDLTDLGYKLADHEIFMLELIKLLNTKIDSSATPITRSNIEAFIKQQFADKDFKKGIKSAAELTFEGNVFIKSLTNGKGYKDLETMLLNKENLNRLLVTDVNDNIRFNLLLDYKLHFKTQQMLSVSDFPNDRVLVRGPNYWQSITSDVELQKFIKKFGGKLVPIHKSGGTLGEIALIPASLLDRLSATKYKYGYMDLDGTLHTGYFLCDDNGNKLNSRLKLTTDKLSLRHHPDWAQEFYDYSPVYNEDLNSFIYQSNFFSAYTIGTGNIIHSNLQDTFINLEHIDPPKQVLPNLDTKRRMRRDINVALRTSPKMTIRDKVSALAIILDQLGGSFTFQAVQRGPVIASDSFLNLQNEGNLYTLDKFKSILASLTPEAGDAIYGDGSIVNPTKSNYWLKQIARGQADSTGKFIRTPKQNLETFYRSWLDLIKNHLSKGESKYFEKHRKNLESLTFAASEEVYKLIDDALEYAFGFTAFISLLAGVMSFSKQTSYEIDFWCHSNYLQAELINKFVGRSLSDSWSGDIGKHFFERVSRDFYFASIFLFGSRTGDRLIRPDSDFLLDGLYKRHRLLSYGDYKIATEDFLNRYFSDYNGEPRKSPKLNEQSFNGRLGIFLFFAKKLSLALEKIVLPNEDCKDLFLNLLMQRIISPTSITSDIVYTLRNVFTKRSNGKITLTLKVSDKVKQKNTIKIDLEFSYEQLKKIVSHDEIFAMKFYYGGPVDYYMDFDIAWRNLAKKVEKSFNLLKEELRKPTIKANERLKVEFYQRTATGLIPITEKVFSDGYSAYGLLSTTFSQSEFDIDPDTDLDTKVLSMIFWMMMEPNIRPVVKLPNGDTFLMLDIYKLYKDGENIFSHSDLMNFVSFHNHELEVKHDDMIIYIMEKFIKHYAEFLDGNINSKLFDLR